MEETNLKSEIKVVVLGEKSLFCRRCKEAVNMYTNKGFGAFSRRCTDGKLLVCYIFQQRDLTLNVMRQPHLR